MATDGVSRAYITLTKTGMPRYVSNAAWLWIYPNELTGGGWGGPCTDQNKFNIQQSHQSLLSGHCVAGTHDKRASPCLHGTLITFHLTLICTRGVGGTRDVSIRAARPHQPFIIQLKAENSANPVPSPLYMHLVTQPES